MWNQRILGSAADPLSKAMLCSKHLPMLKPQGHLFSIVLCLCHEASGKTRSRIEVKITRLTVVSVSGQKPPLYIGGQKEL